MKNIKQIIASPFRKADKINREVIIAYLQPFDGIFLEVGPGDAPILEHLHHVKDDNKIIIDLPSVASYCKTLGYACIEQDAGADEWKLPENSFDVVISNQCLEHIPNTDHFISEAHRVLKGGGVFLISVPNQGALAFLILMLLTINPPMNFVSNKYYGLGNPLSNIRYNKRDVPGYAHLRLFVTRAMNDLLSVYGFRIIKNHGGSWGTPILGRFLARMLPHWGLYTTVLAQKV